MTQIRSPGYPGTALDEAIEITKKIFDHNRQNPTIREAAVKDMGYSGMTGTSAKMLADLVHYGLIEKAGKGGIRVTDIAVRILHPRKPEERRSALLEAAYNPGLFRVIREQWPDGFVSENSLRSYLMRSGFSTIALQPAMKSYLQTYAFLRQEGVSESHSVEGANDQESRSEEQGPAPGSTVALEARSFAGASGRAHIIGTAALGASPQREGTTLMSGERIVFVEEGGPGQYLKLVASGELDAGLLEALENYVTRQKRRIVPTPAGATPSNSQE